MAQTANVQRSTVGKEIYKYAISTVIIALGVAAMYGLKSLAKPPEDVDSNALIPLVTTFEMQPYSGQLDMVVSGSVVPFREIRMAAEVGGRIKKKYDVCQAGVFVTKDTPLLEIDPEEYELELLTIKADVKESQKMLDEVLEEIRGAERNIELAETDYQLQFRDFERNKRLKGVLSDSEVDLAERNLLTSKTQLTTRQNTLEMLKARKARLEASLELSQSQLSKSQLNLKRTVIYAPDDGVIVREMVEQGDYVSKGTQLILFEDTNHAEVICNLTATDLDWIRNHSTGSTLDLETDDPNGRSVYRLPKTAVSIYESGEPDVVWQGVLERFDGIGRDELTKSIPCRIVIEQPVIDTPEGKRALVRGMYVKCRMEVQTSTSAPDKQFLTFPEKGVRPGNFIWVVNEHKLHRVEIEIVDRTKNTLDEEIAPFVVISAENSELKVGDQIVVSPIPQPTENAPVLLKGEELGTETTPVVEKTDASAETTADASSDPTS